MKFALFVSAFMMLLLVVGVFALSDTALTVSESVAADVFGGTADESSDLKKITTDDITETELDDVVKKVDEVIKREHPTELPRAKTIITNGHGWAVTEGNKAAFVKFKTITKQAENGDNFLTFSHGKIIIGDIKIDLQATQDTETLKSYALKNSDGLITGALVLTRQDNSVYNNGKFAVWHGDLTLQVQERGTQEQFVADVVMALETHTVGYQKVKEYKDKVTLSHTGWFTFGDYEFKFQSTPNSKEDRIEAQVYGSNNLYGRMVLERESEGVYAGWLKVEEKGDGDDRLSANLKAEVKREGNQLSGPLRVEVADGSGEVLEGSITIIEDKRYFSTPVTVATPPSFERGDAVDSVDDSDDDEDSDAEDISSPNKGKNKGFWKKFFGFLSGDDSA